MKNEKLVRALKENEDLAKQIIEMWTKEAKTEEIVDVLVKEGIVATAEELEELFAEMQKAKAKAIGLQSMDENQLKKVAGGTDCYEPYTMEKVPQGAHLGKCNERFYTRECDATVEWGSSCWTHDQCTIFSERYFCPVSNQKE